MKKIVVFGGTGGLGKKLIPFLKDKYEVISVSSKEVDITSLDQTKNFFDTNDIDIVLNMSGKKYDIFLSKIIQTDIDDIKSMMDVNMMGNINILASCLPKMIEKKYQKDHLQICQKKFRKR